MAPNASVAHETSAHVKAKRTFVANGDSNQPDREKLQTKSSSKWRERLYCLGYKLYVYNRLPRC
jgi:hypothetical protein